MEGFESVTFFLDEDRSLYGAVSIWESREAADAADTASTPQFTEAIGELADGPDVNSDLHATLEQSN